MKASILAAVFQAALAVAAPLDREENIVLFTDIVTHVDVLTVACDTYTRSPSLTTNPLLGTGGGTSPRTTSKSSSRVSTTSRTTLKISSSASRTSTSSTVIVPANPTTRTTSVPVPTTRTSSISTSSKVSSSTKVSTSSRQTTLSTQTRSQTSTSVQSVSKGTTTTVKGTTSTAKQSTSTKTTSSQPAPVNPSTCPVIQTVVTVTHTVFTVAPTTSSQAKTTTTKISTTTTTARATTSSNACVCAAAAVLEAPPPPFVTFGQLFSSIPLTAAPVTTSTVIPSVTVSTVATQSGTVQILPSLSTAVPDSTGVVNTTLALNGNPTSAPILSTSIASPTLFLNVVALATSTSAACSCPTMTASASPNIFIYPVATAAPPAQIGQRADHPVPRLGVQNNNLPIGTNKFYANFFLGSQTAATWTHPYSVAWSKGGGVTGSWGMAISHIEESQKVYGPNATANPVNYFINPVGIQSLVLSADTLQKDTTISMTNVTQFSANINLLPKAGASPAITFPLVQGMGFVTGIYNGATPYLSSGVFFRTITKQSLGPKAGVTKYSIVLEDGTTWLLYAYSPAGQALNFTVVSNGLAQATSNFNGIIQVAKNPGGDAESLYDAAVGAYPTTATLSGDVEGNMGTYSLTWTKAGMASATLAMFALPHHVESFSDDMSDAVTDVKLQTTTKGIATMVISDFWDLEEPNLPTDLGFAPWRPNCDPFNNFLSTAAYELISPIALSEISQNMTEQTDLNSMYYSGKALAKFAGIVYTISDLLNDTALAQAGLTKLEQAFARFANNVQIYPLTYESAWGGVVSTASYVTGDSGADFGNTYYNDHHFHYGYFIYAASIIGYLNPAWLTANKDYVNTLVRDIANPTKQDTYYPEYRNFDWYHGHGWAHGLYETFDGKDQESSSEDSMHAYALKLWGKTIGDPNMEARGNLQLALNARSLQHYYLYASNNTVEPSNFIGNKVAGIMFENKIDHTTYFGGNIEYVQGIHMLPLLPHSALTRTTEFVSEEWNTYFSNSRADSVVGGWKGVLYSNLALIDPTSSFEFFAQQAFDPSWLDGGASRTWYLAWAAGLGALI